MCGVLMLVPPVRSAPSSMSARASLSVKLSSWYRLFPSRVSLQRRTILSSTFQIGERRLASHNAAYSVEIANFYWGIDGKENYCVVRLRPLWNQLTDEKVGKILCKAQSPFSTANIFYWDPQDKIIWGALTTSCVTGWLSGVLRGRRGSGGRRRSCRRCPPLPRSLTPSCCHPPHRPPPSLESKTLASWYLEDDYHGWLNR